MQKIEQGPDIHTKKYAIKSLFVDDPVFVYIAYSVKQKKTNISLSFLTKSQILLLTIVALQRVVFLRPKRE